MDFDGAAFHFVSVWFPSGPVLSAPVAAQPQSTKEEEEEREGRSVKRKREDAESCPDKREEEEEEEKERGEIKKVCKEGFQLFHHNVCLLLFL